MVIKTIFIKIYLVHFNDHIKIITKSRKQFIHDLSDLNGIHIYSIHD
jgi:hypothetical protein